MPNTRDKVFILLQDVVPDRRLVNTGGDNNIVWCVGGGDLLYMGKNKNFQHGQESHTLVLPSHGYE